MTKGIFFLQAEDKDDMVWKEVNNQLLNTAGIVDTGKSSFFLRFSFFEILHVVLAPVLAGIVLLCKENLK
jgi:hypothetical protein